MSAEWAQHGQHASGPGALLAAQRESLGWSVEQVAEQLKLQPRQVIAIEADDMTALPPLAVVRGFVRAYAKVVRLDPAPLVAMLAADSGLTEAGAAVRSESLASYSDHKSVNGKRPGMPVSAIVAAVLAIGAVIAAYQFDLLPSNSHKEAASAPVLAAQAPVPAPAPAPLASAASSDTASAVSEPAVPEASAPPANGIGLKPTQASIAAAASPAPELKPQAAPAPAPAPAAAPPKPSGSALVIHVREDSWVQINPASGGAAWIKKLVKAGSTETFEVTEPAAIVIGNPDGVEATLRGSALALPKAPGKTYSRVSIQ